MQAPKGRITHFVGVGGIGMSAIANIMVHLGYSVSGSDLRDNEETQKLASMGARVFLGHRASNLGKDVGTVVLSSAVASNNPEVLEAKKRGLLILQRAQMLAELMRKKQSIVVSGSHGKTTTTAMITTMMIHVGFDPTSVIGGRLKSIAGNARMGSDEWFVAESDESDGSFLQLLPTIAVVTNVDREHLSHYGNYANLEKSFVKFCAKVPFDGQVVLCADDFGSKSVANLMDRKIMTYGITETATLMAKNVELSKEGASLDLIFEQKPFAKLRLAVTGMHNVYNAMAAVGVGIHLGIPAESIVAGLSAYEGIGRRLEFKGLSSTGVRVYDDYAHHPSEIQASIAALSVLADGHKVHVLFQPHRYSRLGDLWNEFTTCFQGVDTLGIVPVYAAGETPRAGIGSQELVQAIGSNAFFATSIQEGVERMRDLATEGDLLVAMGAGDITMAAKHWMGDA